MDRRTKSKMVLIAWSVVFFFLGFGVWSFQAGHLMIEAYLILSTIIYFFYAFLARCPRCGVPILLKPMQILGMKVFRWSLLIPERCGHCGETLS